MRLFACAECGGVLEPVVASAAATALFVAPMVPGWLAKLKHACLRLVRS